MITAAETSTICQHDNPLLGDTDELLAMTNMLIDRDEVLDKERKRLRTFNKIIIDSNEGDNQLKLVNSLLKSTINLFNFDMGVVYLTSHKTGISSRYTSFNYPEHKLLDQAFVESPEFINGKPQYFENYDQVYTERSIALGGIKTLVRIPIIYDGKVEGCINLCSYEQNHVDPFDCSMLKTIGKHLGHVLYRINIEINLQERINEIEATNQELNASFEELQNYTNEIEIKTNELDCERSNFKKLVDKVSDMIIVTDMNGIILHTNISVCKTLNFNESIDGKYIGIIHDKHSNADIVDIIEELNQDNNKTISIQLNLCDKSTKQSVPVITTLSTGYWSGNLAIFGLSKLVGVKDDGE
jgi:hypothetical protein